MEPRKTCPGIDMEKFRQDFKIWRLSKKVEDTRPVKIEISKDRLDKILDLLTVLLGGKVEHS